MNEAYKELKLWENSQECKDTKIAKKLLSSFEVDASDLTNTLKQKYHMSYARCNSTLNNLATRSIPVRLGTFDKVVKLRVHLSDGFPGRQL